MGAQDGEPFDQCPTTLTKHMASASAREAKGENIWIDCNGRNAADQEAVEGRLSYFPASRAIPISYFPYLGQRNLVHMECRAYYRGVKHDKKDKLGLVQFEVQVL